MQKTFEQWLSLMESCHPEEIELGLERSRSVLQRLLVKDLNIPVITVAGTNGKGSTIAVLEALAKQAGIKPLVYTSPHFHDFRERLRFDGNWLSKEQHITAFEAVESARNSEELTYFEFATLSALKCTELLQPDLLLLETGLGGRLDAVNLLAADIAIITTIDYDHQDWLGDDLVSIAREKAGIIHPHKIAIIADPQFPGEIIKEIKLITKSLFVAGNEFHHLEMDKFWRWNNSQYGPWNFDLLSFPFSNASAAIEAWSLLPFTRVLSEQFIQQALSKIQLSGRLQTLSKNPEVIIDVAHNPQAFRALVGALSKKPCSGNTYLVLGMLEDKNAANCIQILKAIVDYWYLTDLPTSRGRTAKNLQQLIIHSETGKNRLKCHSSPVKAYQAAYDNASNNDRILICGSFYTVGPIQRMFQESCQ